jgi:hypothetical protein
MVRVQYELQLRRNIIDNVVLLTGKLLERLVLHWFVIALEIGCGIVAIFNSDVGFRSYY